MKELLPRLIYLSPLPWSSFEQRPHKFVKWFHSRTGGEVLWVDPYPTRLPVFTDIKRISTSLSRVASKKPSWLEVVRPTALPIEPLSRSGSVNRFFWRKTLNKILEFSCNDDAIIAFGKPSALANQVLDMLPGISSIYDAMDDFPSFYDGVSKYAMKAMIANETQLVKRVNTLLVSSSVLLNRWSVVRPDAKLIPNGLDVDMLPSEGARSQAVNSPFRFGYVGTIGAWFDWSWLVKLAESRPADDILVVGPLLKEPPRGLPSNIALKPACSHFDALVLMRSFDVGLIPFINNKLTSSVDPIKYYEYRALGVPVLSTSFGEMSLRNDEPGTYISKSYDDIQDLTSQALEWFFTQSQVKEFAATNSWCSRFDGIGLC